MEAPRSRAGPPLPGPLARLKGLAGGASHDPDDDRGYAPFYRPRFGHRNFLWIYPALEFENAAFHRGGVDI